MSSCDPYLKAYCVRCEECRDGKTCFCCCPGPSVAGWEKHVKTVTVSQHVTVVRIASGPPPPGWVEEKPGESRELEVDLNLRLKE